MAHDASSVNRHAENDLNRSMSKTPIKLGIPKDADRYKMNHCKRGKCVVFNHEIFDRLSDRTGTRFDAKRIEKTFSTLNFTVEICNDYTKEDVINKIHSLSKEDYTDNDCISIFILTHGSNNDVLYAKDYPYHFEEIWKPFTADKCITLAGKPKLFFLQACRGDEFDEGVLVAQCNSEIIPESSYNTYNIPTLADFLFVYSTPEDYVSWRNTMEGSCFIQGLCDVLEQYASKTDLQQMILRVCQNIAVEFCVEEPNPNHGCKQIPVSVSTLIRCVYFS